MRIPSVRGTAFASVLLAATAVAIVAPISVVIRLWLEAAELERVHRAQAVG